MKKTIYIIIDGCYSDWFIHGYFNDIEKAEKYVVWYNANHNGYGDEAYIQEHELLEPEIDYNAIKVLRNHKVVFDKRGNSWNMRNEPDRYDIYTGVKKKTVSGLWAHKKQIYHVEVTTHERKKAEKIAQDLLYKWLAESNGL